MLRNLGINFKNVLTNGKKERRIKSSGKLSASDTAGVVALYDELTKNFNPVWIEAAKRFFHDVDVVDVDMIVNEAFPKFEEVLGKDNFQRLKAHFRIGTNKARLMNSVDLYLSLLRTVENAQYYLSDYKKLIHLTAEKLDGAPEAMTELEKAKFVRMFRMIISRYHYFGCDIVIMRLGNGEQKSRIDETALVKNNSIRISPELLFMEYCSGLFNYPEKSFQYELIAEELKYCDKRVFKEILEFAEMGFENGMFVSKNKAYIAQTLGTLRNLKCNFHREMGRRPMEFYCTSKEFQKLDLYAIYLLYRKATTSKLEELDKCEDTFYKVEGSRVQMQPVTSYRLFENYLIGGPVEIERFIRTVKFFAEKNLKLSVQIIDPAPVVIEIGLKDFFNAIEFGKHAKYITDETTIEEEASVAVDLVTRDKNQAISRYLAGEITIFQAKADMKITPEEEKTSFNLKETPLEIMIRFGIEEGYIQSADEVDEELLIASLIEGNESAIEKFDSNKDKRRLKTQIGFSDQYAKMYFSLRNVDAEQIEADLLRLKRSNTVSKKVDDRQKGIIRLYCYIIENEVPCGPRLKKPKRIKSLKPANLRNLL